MAYSSKLGILAHSPPNLRIAPGGPTQIEVHNVVSIAVPSLPFVSHSSALYIDRRTPYHLAKYCTFSSSHKLQGWPIPPSLVHALPILDSTPLHTLEIMITGSNRLCDTDT